MNIYLASQFARQKELRQYRDILESLGHTVTSTWLDEQEDARDSWHQAQVAKRDIYDLERSDTFIIFTDPEDNRKVRQSKNVELGIAIAWHLRIILIGPPENPYEYLPRIENYEWPDWINNQKLLAA